MTTIATLRDAVALQLIGRDREASIVTLGLIAREHVLLVGPPGTGKSLLCRTAAELVQDARYCERLLSPTTAPEAIWGPISISALREDRYEHVTDGYAADAHILYLDEVGRASPASSTRCSICSDPSVRHSSGRSRSSRRSLPRSARPTRGLRMRPCSIAGLLRASVQYLAAGLRRQLLTFAPPVSQPVDDARRSRRACRERRRFTWSHGGTRTRSIAILGDLDEAGIAVSDRRLRASDKIARAAALLRANGSTTIEPGDLEALQWVLWSVPEHAATAAQKVVARANPVGAKLDSMLAEADEIVRAAVDAATRLDAATKIDALLKEAKQVASQPGANGRAAKVVKYVEREHTRVQGAHPRSLR
jgi:MoxR-like ATPase